MDGVLVVDKPEGMTSHDVVAIARRALGERRIGHTGTLDPLATGVLPLACGRATRFVRFLSASDKSYDATIRFGLVTDSYDVTGRPLRETDARPTEASVRAALETFRGEQLQLPPAYSAKKVDGRRAYELARQDKPVELAPVAIRISTLDLLSLTPDRAVVRVTGSAGFYVRSLAYDLGERLGTGACLEALRRIRSGAFDLDSAVTVAELQQGRWSNALRGLETLLPEWDTAIVTSEGRTRVSHGQVVRPSDIVRVAPGTGVPVAGPRSDPRPWTRIVDESGALLALATGGHDDGALHPDVVLT